MKIRQAQTSATYILPDPGELDKRIAIRLRVDEPNDDFGVSPRIRRRSALGEDGPARSGGLSGLRTDGKKS